ncbi:hypothetical protein ABZX30_12140 [Streptomyces sp. NPDC004542]|uniref:hypothetical protein n=1 Tax=Streptomyces sp. NPDC004542 TaxID=3154281 RepID=UPI0033AD4C4D
MSTKDILSGGTTTARPVGAPRLDLLGIYLNDHLAGATVGTRRAGYVARAHQGTPLADVLEPLAREIAEDRESLLGIMERLGIPARRYKVVAAAAAECAGRLKPNGRIVARSPLSSVLEFEFLRLGVEGKAAAWRSLRPLAEVDRRLEPAQLDELLARAERQLRTLEQLRSGASQEVFRGRR